MDCGHKDSLVICMACKWAAVDHTKDSSQTLIRLPDLMFDLPDVHE